MFTGQLMNKTERDREFKFLDEYVYACPTDGYCNLIEGVEREVHDWQQLRITKDGDSKNYWHCVKRPNKNQSIEYLFCIGCFHPVGQWEARKVNEYFGYKTPSLESILEGLPEI